MFISSEVLRFLSLTAIRRERKITNDYADFQVSAFANSWRVENTGAVTSQPIRIAVTGTVLAIVAVVFIARTVLRRNRERLPGWTLALEYYFEALWVYLLIANWLSDVNIKKWLESRRLVAWLTDQRAMMWSALLQAGALVTIAIPLWLDDVSITVAWLALAASHAAATPTLSFSSTTIRSAVFFPMPLTFESDATSPATTFALNDATLDPLSTSSAVFGPMPLT